MIRLLINTREIYKIESYSQYLGKQCFSGIRGAKSSVFCVVFGRSLFVFIILAMVLKPILCNFYSSYDIFFFCIPYLGTVLTVFVWFLFHYYYLISHMLQVQQSLLFGGGKTLLNLNFE